MLLVIGAAKAVTITVNSTSGSLGTAQTCTLRAAIRAANTDAPFAACVAGSGADTIVLPSGAIIPLSQIDNNTIGNNALPKITTEITIEGNHAVIYRTNNAPMMRFFDVGSYGGVGHAHLTLNQLTLSNGLVSGTAGAIYNDGILHLNQVRLQGNQASFEGGALACYESQAECHLHESILINNSANYAGAIIVDLNASLWLDKTTVYGNQATIGTGAADVGAIYVESGTADISHSTIANNSATRYGGLYASSGGGPFPSPGAINLSYSTVVNNNPIGLVGQITVSNTILQSNVDGNCRVPNSIVSAGYNHSNDLTCGFAESGDVENTNAQLAGPPVIHDYGLYYTLMYSSGTLDAADPNDCGGEDQRHLSRPLDGNNDGLARCDKGAVEMPNYFIYANGFEVP